MNAIADKPSPVGETQESRATRKSRRKLVLIPLLLLALIGAAITGTWWWNEARWIETTDDAYVQGDIAVLSPRVDGDVIAVHTADNQAVRKGDALIELDPADWRARVAQSEATVAEAAAQIATLHAQIAQQQTNLGAMAAGRANAAAERERTAQDAQRSNTLAARGWASRQANDMAVTESRKADGLFTMSTAQEAAARDQLTIFAAQLAQAEARRLGSEAALTLARNNLSYTVIRAPFDGIVGNRAAQVGQHVSPGTRLMALSPPTEQLYITANFKETQIRRMHPGLKARLVPDIDPAGAVDGTVDSLPPASGALFSLLPPENATGNFTKVVQRFPLKLRPADGRANWLRAGLSVTAEVDTRGPDAVRLGWWGTATSWFRR